MIANYPEYEQLLARTQLVLFMLGMGATLSIADFTRIFRQPRSLIVGLTGQIGLGCLVALGIGALVGLVAELKAGIITGMLLVAVLPGGNMSKMFTYIGRGNMGLSISMSACATLLCMVTIPLVIRLIPEKGLISDYRSQMDLLIIQELVLFLILPVLGGMVFARLFPRYQEIFSKITIWIGFVVAAVMVIGSLGSGRVKFQDYGWPEYLSIIAFCVLTQQISMLPFRLFRWPDPNTVAVGIETTMRNINVSLLLLALVYGTSSPLRPADDAVGAGVWFVTLYYAGTAFFIGVPLAVRMRRVIRRQQMHSSPKLTEEPVTETV